MVLPGPRHDCDFSCGEDGPRRLGDRRQARLPTGCPPASCPDAPAVARVFEDTEFTVVVDSFLTDTARRASLVLPVPTLLEDDDVLGAYGHHWLSESRAVVPPPDGVLHELELFQQLARRVGLESEMAGSIDDYKRRLLRPVGDRGASLEQLRAGPVRSPIAPTLLFADRTVSTPNGRVQLLSDVPARPEPPAGYPLWLFSNSTEKSQASQWAGRWARRAHLDSGPSFGCRRPRKMAQTVTRRE